MWLVVGAIITYMMVDREVVVVSESSDFLLPV